MELFGRVTAQGSPQFGLKRFGVPSGGAFDSRAHLITNVLAKQNEGALTLELTMANLTLKATQDVTLGISGAECRWFINGAPGFGSARVPIPAGAILQLIPPTEGVRTYIGGPFLDLQPGQTFKVGNVIQTTQQSLEPLLRLAMSPVSPSTLKFVSGPQAEAFDVEQLESTTWLVSRQSDRMGIRVGPEVFTHELEMMSEPAIFGTVQVLPNGSLIILGPDGPTIGGYPKIAVVISSDLDAVAQLRPGQPFHFLQVSLTEAAQLDLQRREDLKRSLAELRLGSHFVR